MASSKPKKKTKLAVILGARPNFIKAAPLLHKAKDFPQFEFHLIHTGQHYDQNMSEIFFKDLEIPLPEVLLEISGLKDSDRLGRMIAGVSTALEKISPAGVIVFGDVNSTLAGALAAKKNNLPLVHIEAGLRSFDKRMPEETNRFIVDQLADLLFVTEPSGYSNLIREGYSAKQIKYVGNLMIESLELFKQQITSSEILKRFKLQSKNFVVVTIHRDENISSLINLKKITSLLEKLSQKNHLLFPIHPHTKNILKEKGLDKDLSGLTMCEPLGYFDFLKLILESGGVLTDSGGIQEEASHLGVPCATLRDNTERPITLELGSNKLFNLDTNHKEIDDHLSRKDFAVAPIPLWDNEVSTRILTALDSFFNP